MSEQKFLDLQQRIEDLEDLQIDYTLTEQESDIDTLKQKVEHLEEKTRKQAMLLSMLIVFLKKKS